MPKETTQAAILILRAKALETYGVIKELHQQQAESGHAEKISTLALSLAQYEGAMITLQQYFDNPQHMPPAAPDIPTDLAPATEPEPRIIGPEDSASMRRVMEVQEAARKAKRTDES